MSIDNDTKQALIEEYKLHSTDKGSTAVQIAVLTKRIQNLTEHFKTHKKDNHSRRGLLMLVSRRKKLISYLKDTNYDKYVEVLSKLKIRGVK